MTDEKIVQVCKLYDERFRLFGSGIFPVRADATKKVNNEEVLNHLRWMVQETVSLVEQGRREKAFRWLGFIQGALWSYRMYTIEELKNHNKPDGEEE